MADCDGRPAVVEGIEVIPVSFLAEAVGFFTGQIEIDPAPSRVDDLFERHDQYDVDFADVRGQEMAKRAITVAAAGCVGAPTTALDAAG